MGRYFRLCKLDEYLLLALTWPGDYDVAISHGTRLVKIPQHKLVVQAVDAATFVDVPKVYEVTVRRTNEEDKFVETNSPLLLKYRRLDQWVAHTQQVRPERNPHPQPWSVCSQATESTTIEDLAQQSAELKVHLRATDTISTS
ncbi:hypothetical protein INT44_002832 [Umbelopsis vinacea]|uniref:Uncharacterized protein n=1 Tax=Umbelopsis vinacea TaxID=44442 RepID=A0A8H7UNU1_9FUNG|nr:hypothetical protein INT44_002832 [Umbelopsis vinacea]